MKLTLFSSALFLVSFWVFSAGLYIWMENSFGESYISEIEQQGEHEFEEQDIDIADIAGDVAMDRLENTLLILNGALIIIYYLEGKEVKSHVEEIINRRRYR